MIALIQASVISYMILYTSAAETGYDDISDALQQFNGPCVFERVANTWKLLTTDVVSLVLLDFIPFLVVCFMNGAIILTMKRRAEEWGREDPQKLVVYEIPQ